jgi:DNA-binding NarL/FixJ family response regulator
MTVLIVDDEPVARRGLRRQLAQLPGVTCVGECGTRAEAVAAIRDRQPDVVLLDIQLGRANAFDIVEDIGVEAMPLVVFVTAYDGHAVKAFEVHALDYVLKPVDPERLREAIERAASTLSQQRSVSLADRLEGFLSEAQQTMPWRGVAGGASARALRRARRRRPCVALGDRTHRVVRERGQLCEGAQPRPVVPDADNDGPRRATSRHASTVHPRPPFRRCQCARGRLTRTQRKSSFIVHLRSGATVTSSRFYQPAIRRLLHEDP